MAGKTKKPHTCTIPARGDNPTPWMDILRQGNGSAAKRKADAKLVVKRR